MAATQARSGFGTLLQRGDGGDPTEVFATIGEVKNVSGPSLSRDTDDATHMESPGAWRERVSTLRDGGEVTVDLNFAPSATNTATTIGDLEDDDPINYRIVFPATGGGTAKRFAFAAFLTAFTPAAPHDGRMTASATFQITGEPVFEDVA